MNLQPISLKPIVTGALVVASILFGIASGPAAAQQPRKGGTLTIALETDTATLDTLGISSINDRQVAMILYDTLLEFDAKGNVVPGLAEKLDAAADATSFKLTLRNGVKF